MDNMGETPRRTALSGLTGDEVNERIENGMVNVTDNSAGKTVWEIVRSNLLTYFNLIFLIITVVLCCVGSYRNLTFLPIVIGNTLIGIIQELRAKRTLDRMNLLNAPHTVVVRDGVRQKIAAEELVRDDVVILSAGDQIPADAMVLSGSVNVNEALLTGEADEIEKGCGCALLSGSYVVSGECYARLKNVGEDSYISKLTREAKAMGDGEQSEMIRSINRIVKWIGIAIIPIGIILFVQSYYFGHETIQRSVVSAVAAIIGMIPEGLYMLTTIALALGTIRLARRSVLLHDMKSIETLARVDVLCVDKTGTITEPDMRVDDVVCIEGGGMSGEALRELVADYAAASVDNNATMQAIREYAAKLSGGAQKSRRAPRGIQPFSSSVKYSSVTFADGVFLLGAPEFVMKEGFERIAPELEPYTASGCRVLLIARGEADSDVVVPLGFVVLSNPIRESARETFAYFREQGVEVKVISGDNPVTVSEIARQAGIENADRYVDASLLDTDSKLERAATQYTVFGRVTPKQKQKLVQALQKAGHTVAMTGDGVNDILAMKDADCSVAMASGSEAAAQAAQVVLMDSEFAHMPDVVFEGRRVVNNIQRSASLFLVKNIFSLLLSLFSAISGVTYPLEPAQISLISMFTIGLPGFLLALEANRERISGNFLKNVLLRAFPAGLTDMLAVGALVICGEVFRLPDGDIATAATMLLSVVGFMILIKISHPMTKMKYAILGISVAGLLFCGIFLKQLFALSDMSQICVLLMVVFAFAAESLFRNLTWCTEAAEVRLVKFAEERRSINAAQKQKDQALKAQKERRKQLEGRRAGANGGKRSAKKPE